MRIGKPPPANRTSDEKALFLDAPVPSASSLSLIGSCCGLGLALANIPNLLDPLLTFTREMREGAAIEARLRELAIMTVALVTGASYEFNHHWNSALKAGVRREQLEQLADAETSDAFDERERAIVRYAREATLSLKVSDETWSALRFRPDEEVGT